VLSSFGALAHEAASTRKSLYMIRREFVSVYISKVSLVVSMMSSLLHMCAVFKSCELMVDLRVEKWRPRSFVCGMAQLIYRGGGGGGGGVRAGG
jgi:ABC-type long-subunit fatty acid transport system fused permease/ATPase subunit